MTIDQLYRYDNNLYAFLLLGIMLLFVILKKDIYDYSRKLFYRMIVFNMLILLVEILAWAFDGVVSTPAIIANYVFNCLLIVMEPIMAAFWLCYIDYKIYASKERLKRRLYYLHGSIFAASLLVINIFSPVAFSIDENNIYHRGDWLWLSLLVVFGLVLYTVVLVWRNRKELQNNMIIFIALFAFLPVLVSFIQLFVYGLILTWAIVALALVFAYYVIELKGSSEDYLTGLYSRKKMDEILTGKVEEGQDVSVIMIDLEYFKEINDKYGHRMGDEVLIQFAKAMLRSFRDRYHIARIGGDEFLLITKQETIADLEQERLALLNEMQTSPHPHLNEIGISFGAATFSGSDDLSVDHILDTVDNLMYEDKSIHKNKKRRRTDR